MITQDTDANSINPSALFRAIVIKFDDLDKPDVVFSEADGFSFELIDNSIILTAFDEFDVVLHRKNFNYRFIESFVIYERLTLEEIEQFKELADEQNFDDDEFELIDLDDEDDDGDDPTEISTLKQKLRDQGYVIA